MRTVLLILFVFLLQTPSFAENKFDFGVKLGYLSSSIKRVTKHADQYTPNYSDPFKNNRNGPFLGGFAEFNFNNYLSFDFELNYLQKGAQDKILVTSADDMDGSKGNYANYDFQLDYLQSLISLKPSFPFLQSNIYGKIGLTFNYLLRASGFGSWYNAKDIVFGYTWGFGVKLNKIFEHKFLLEICRDVDFSEFYSNKNFEMKNEAWVLKFGLIL